MAIQIQTVRIAGFRGLEDIEVGLGRSTIFTGINNSGKTSFLKALQLVFGNRQFLSQDEFFIKGNDTSDKITIDVLIVPTDPEGKRCESFSENHEILFTTDRIQNNDQGESFIPLRTVITFDELTNSYKTQQYIMGVWPKFSEDEASWVEADDGVKTTFYFEEIPFFYVGAQRDILEDIKLRGSYLGKMLSKVEYSPSAIDKIEKQIQELNKQTVDESTVLSTLKESLKELDTAMNSESSEGIEITPFTKKLRDLNKGLTIYYTDKHESFSMEYHGMGTRSWSSLLTLKALISLLAVSANNDDAVFFPILAIEEPEAHLHPNAQKQLYNQMHDIDGQKVISTHSPYVAATASLAEVRSLYKAESIICGRVDIEALSPNDLRKINRQVVHTRGEIFFSRVIVYFEGETEEQMLPLFFRAYFDKSPVEMGVDFVGVGGYGNYLPFIRFSESLNIPWLIFSDAENSAAKPIKASVEKQFVDSGTRKELQETIVFLDDGNDFEKQLISDGFQEEIKLAMIGMLDIENQNALNAKKSEIESYNDDDLYRVMTGAKTSSAPVIAESIVNSANPLPASVLRLFEIIGSTLNSEQSEDDGTS